MIELLEQIRLVLRQAAADGEVKLSAIDLASVAHRERVAARRVATVDEAVSELRASSGDLAGVGELCEIVVDGVPSGRLGRYSPEGAVIPLVTGIRPSRRLGVCVDACRVRSSTGQCPGRSAGPICPRRMDGSCRGAVCEGRGRDAAPRSPLGRSQAGTGFDAAGGTRIGGNQGRPVFRELIDAVGTQLESAAHVLGADEGSHSELEEQPRRGRIPVIEWLDETVNALNDETPFRLRFLAVGDELDVELDWQEGSGTSLRAACLLDQLEHLAEQLVIDGNGKISAADLVPVAHRSKLPTSANCSTLFRSSRFRKCSLLRQKRIRCDPQLSMARDRGAMVSSTRSSVASPAHSTPLALGAAT